MQDFAGIELLSDTTIIETHQFPLFEYKGLHQKCCNQKQQIAYDCIIVSLASTHDIDDEKRLNLIVASGYVDEESDITFRNHAESGYFYAYFNFKSLNNEETE